MGLVMNQVCALQKPLDMATESLEEQAKNDGLVFLYVQFYMEVKTVSLLWIHFYISSSSYFWEI